MCFQNRGNILWLRTRQGESTVLAFRHGRAQGPLNNNPKGLSQDQLMRSPVTTLDLKGVKNVSLTELSIIL